MGLGSPASFLVAHTTAGAAQGRQTEATSGAVLSSQPHDDKLLGSVEHPPSVSSPSNFCRALLRMRDRCRLRLGPPTKSHVSKEGLRSSRLLEEGLHGFEQLHAVLFDHDRVGAFGKLQVTLAGCVHLRT